MKITERKLRKIIRELLVLEVQGSQSQDSDGEEYVGPVAAKVKCEKEKLNWLLK